MKITVVLCTYNRCQALTRALASLAAQAAPDTATWDVLVVDNNSGDGTREVIDQFCRQYPGRFRYLFEPRQGKSFALNSAIRNSAGDILAFVDDDVTLAPSWLARVAEAFRESDAAGIGGRVVAEWAGRSQPSWLRMSGPYALRSVLVSFDHGNHPVPLTTTLPLGANMAFRREMFEKYGGFRTDLGPTIGSEIRGEDSEFCRRLVAAGQRLRYEPKAVVYHPVAENRVTKKYFREWFYASGRATVRTEGIPRNAARWFGVPRYLVRILVLTTSRWIFASQPYVRFYHKVRLWYTLGEIQEAYQQALHAKQVT